MTVKKDNRIIISEDISKIEKSTFNDVRDILQVALKEYFVFENGYISWDVDFDQEFVYWDVNYYEYENGNSRDYNITYKVKYILDGVTASLGDKPVKVVRTSKYEEVKDKSLLFGENGDVNKVIKIDVKNESFIEKIVDKVFKKFKKEENSFKKNTVKKNGSFYIKKFNEEEQISYEPLFTSPDVPDAVGDSMTEEESLKMVKQIKEKIDNKTMKFNLFHKVESKAAEWIDCFSNPWPSCYVGDQEVLKSQPVGILKWHNKEAWKLRKENIIKGASIEGKAGNKRKVEDEY